MKYHLEKSNGYSVATIEQKSSKTVLAYISVDLHTESSAESRATELIYTEALLSGAGKYSRAEFLDVLNQLGASISVSISDGVLTVFIRTSADAYKKVLTLLEIMLKEPTFRKTELIRIKLTTVNEIKESKENSKAIAKEELRNSIYSLHDRRYTNDEDTSIKQIATITPKHLQKLHTKLRTTVWTCTQASGAPEIELFKKTIEKCNQAKGDAEPLRIHQQKPPQPGLTLRDIPSRQNIDFSIGAPLPITMHHPDFLPLMFGITVLGGAGFACRLMSTVREQEGLTYDIRAQTETFFCNEQGYVRISTFFSPAKSILGLTSTFREIRKIHNDGITKDELSRFKKILHTRYALKNDSISSLLNELHSYHSQKFTLKEMEEYKNSILNVTLKEVNAAIKTYLNPSTLTISGAGPVKSVRKDLQTFAKTVS